MISISLDLLWTMHAEVRTESRRNAKAQQGGWVGGWEGYLGSFFLFAAARRRHCGFMPVFSPDRVLLIIHIQS